MRNALSLPVKLLNQLFFTLKRTPCSHRRSSSRSPPSNLAPDLHEPLGVYHSCSSGSLRAQGLASEPNALGLRPWVRPLLGHGDSFGPVDPDLPGRCPEGILTLEWHESRAQVRVLKLGPIAVRIARRLMGSLGTTYALPHSGKKA